MTADEDFTKAIQSAYGSFGIAWRLLDDLRDIETDMMKGVNSAVYVCLPEDKRQLWDKQTGKKFDKRNDSVGIIINCVLENSIIDRLTERICNELQSAASIAESYHMARLADEFRCLLTPMMNNKITYELQC